MKNSRKWRRWENKRNEMIKRIVTISDIEFKLYDFSGEIKCNIPNSCVDKKCVLEKISKIENDSIYYRVSVIDQKNKLNSLLMSIELDESVFVSLKNWLSVWWK